MSGVGFRPFVYGLYDPADPGHIRYVGMASAYANRPYIHARLAKRPETQRSYVINWVKKLQAAGRDYSVMVLEEMPPGTRREFMGFIEACYIRSLREIGHRLTNQAEGGYGGNLGPEVNAKRATSMLGNVNSVGAEHSEESRRKVSESRKRYFDQHPELRKRQVITCPCGRMRTVKLSNQTAKYCSPECYHQFKSRLLIWKPQRTVVCPCGNTFVVKASRVHAKFCSNTCRFKYFLDLGSNWTQ